VAWLEAPVWYFMLPPGLCGRNGVLGLWLPSVDKVGRYSPLTIAAAAPGDWLPYVGVMTAFLGAAEQAGRDALEHDLSPAELMQRIGEAFVAVDAPAPDLAFVPSQAAWWTEGGPRVASRFETARVLPEGSGFAALIDDDWAAAGPATELAIAPTADPS
jgi:type VI secretion system protein ImpM